MDIRKGLARSLKLARRASRFSQEDFSDVSGRTYLSEVERGLKSPTLEKIDSIARAMKIHPLTVLTLAYTPNLDLGEVRILQTQVKAEAGRMIEDKEAKRPRKSRRT